MQLYKYTENLREAMTALESMDLDEQTIADTLAADHADFDDKAVNVAAYIKNVMADISVYKEHEKEIATKRKALENRAAQMKQYLRFNMATLGKDKIKGGMISVSLGKPSKSLVVGDVGKLPSDCVITTQAADKVRIKAILDAGEPLEGAEYVEGEPRLTIR